ncbi:MULTISPECIES: 4-hydroxybenzoate octaprenyltransferase [Legionella]|uniref:4-hydroxybenzoate octaprenyltransferase n=1 Tax=Legionella septentrionalis TaxID=2498109 RepID=A0A433JKV6_9GAMM|nr:MULTISPECIES: 4-hydroxybenzoate octaprenyltransferase [Legionella]MCP0913509.1 4-hydroxybenzoate octaprenyltransferase [Legionella sp. 27cVA30]RUQ89717.1 4-hydroxybenzoate octaprenyltransferase [Legionella septentrionalis]RUQ99738.1 4-hydroxybenzoate octaprenyltransferase [Legionella septentrionalis]RUR11068.1 4-hydroxybenzoate octaprenyltransferase [Legionella septentrionalis]
MRLGSYFRLMRFHKPVGILLLWFPTAWALWIANNNNPPVQLIAYFLLGTVFMRAAGCVVNDIADRNIDKHVKRTKERPLTCGEVNLAEALILLLILLFAALLIVMQLPAACFYYALFAVVITVLYPFCKRFLQAPQLVLGLAFSMGIPMAFSASHALFDYRFVLLLAINFAWIIAYDTMYAMVDRADDLRIGVKSTAIFFADYDRMAILFLQISFHSSWLVLAYFMHLSSLFYAGWGLAALVLLYQQQLVNSRIEKACFKAFSCNNWYGLIMWLGIIAH